MAKVSRSNKATQLILLAVFVGICSSSPDLPAPSYVMKALSLSFARQLDGCRRELNLQSAILHDFLRFWKMGENLTNRDMGCMIMCVEKRLKLIDGTYNFIPAHVEGFLKASGADDEMTPKVMEWINNCRSMAQSQDLCHIGLEFLNCFKAGIEGMGWTPP